MLSAQSDVEVAGEAETGEQAMELVATLKPDVLLLDIELPGCSGLDVAACLPEPRPRVIFCTAYDQHAVDAFELHAVDYLLKPVNRTRLAQALDRVREPRRVESAAGLDDAVKRKSSGPVRFLARNGFSYVVVSEARVFCFVSEGGLTRLVVDGSQYWMDPTLNELEARLDSGRFFRVSRAALIALNAVTEVIPITGGSGEVLLKNGLRLEVSRRRFRDLLDALG